MNSENDIVRGCLVGGAVGDALGYAIEFLNERQIFSQYGKKGITGYKFDKKTGKALISDDTQMSLFTASGMLVGSEHGMLYDIEQAYLDWLTTQYYTFDEARNIAVRNSWLRDIPGLYSPRAPGNTCLSALKARAGSDEIPESFIASKLNNSKGCGGVMRAAPIGLLSAVSIEEADIIAAEAAAVTHSNSLGYMPAAVLAHIVYRIANSKDRASLKQIIIDARNTAKKLFSDDPYIKDLTGIIDLAVRLAENKDDDLDNIHRLGEGWVGDEALAISLYCSLRHQNDFSAGIIASVNHNGDSDSTGAVTGNILGALCGYDAIEPRWKKELELLDVILKAADDIAESRINYINSIRLC